MGAHTRLRGTLMVIAALAAGGAYSLGRLSQENASPETFSSLTPSVMEDFRDDGASNSFVCFSVVETFLLGGMAAYDGAFDFLKDSEIDGPIIVAWAKSTDQEEGERTWMCRFDPSIVVMNGPGTRELEPFVGFGKLVSIEQLTPVSRVWDCTDQEICREAERAVVAEPVRDGSSPAFTAPPISSGLSPAEQQELTAKAVTCASLLRPLWDELRAMSATSEFQARGMGSDVARAWLSRVEAAQAIDMPPDVSDTDRAMGSSCLGAFDLIGAPYPFSFIPIELYYVAVGFDTLSIQPEDRVRVGQLQTWLDWAETLQ